MRSARATGLGGGERGRLIVWHLAALTAGDPARDAPEAELIAAARRRRSA